MLYHFTKLSDNLLYFLIRHEAGFAEPRRTQSEDDCSESIAVSGLTVLSQRYEPASVTSLISFVIPDDHMRLISLDKVKILIYT